MAGVQLPAPAWIDAGNPALQAKLVSPVKKIKNDSDMDVWRTSASHDALILFVMRLGQASRGLPTRPVDWSAATREQRTGSPDAIDRVISLLQRLDAWADAIEPQTNPQRFGNRAFRTWGAELCSHIEALHTELLPPEMHAFAIELQEYLLGAFGSFQRLDYGTGHELNFAAWLGYLHRLGLFVERGANAERIQATEQRLALEVFPSYLRVAWHLQDRYALEPAGSHGVWGLDDYQFIPYIIGAAQMCDAEALSPAEAAQNTYYPYVTWKIPRFGARISPEDTLVYAPPALPATVPIPNLYISSLARVNSLKRGAFQEHSPLLHDIATNVPTWYKVYTGMLKMYDAECLLKFPVVQHFGFGSVGFSWPNMESPT
ncbi:Rrd1p [Malassezia vespertilionis]|uniref:Serine/threonine-protein phosphatase 2A activator n=1 Tax=Malassezia vespertilionis TaxID=2020962 RepID=A0A2N1JFA2_9BASI|nr:Rrd1p [Malassezia vespertilionis]